MLHGRKIGVREVSLAILDGGLETLQQRPHLVQVLKVVLRLTWLLFEDADVLDAVGLEVVQVVGRLEELEYGLVL